ncbi:MazG-like family protein [Streptomyces sp. NPDC001698]|uniref:MazG-like family protein n=1 Tax=Streptomyces sp. NPDC001698 TaxID=3364601 RepID=UPI0036775EF2
MHPRILTKHGPRGEQIHPIVQLTDQSAQVMQDAERAVQVREEMADVLAYLLRLADVLDVDLEVALTEKIDKNRCKYPVHLARGKADKYTKLGG